MHEHALTEAIADLLAVVGRDPSFVAGPLDGVAEHLSGAVDSYLGLQVLTSQIGHPLTLTALPADGVRRPIATSMAIPLSALGPEAAGTITFFASRPGAFVDLAADLTYALRLAVDVIVIDDDPGPIGARSGITGLAEISTINRAIGVLITRGHDPDEAIALLRRDAERAGTTTHAHAVVVLQTRSSPTD